MKRLKPLAIIALMMLITIACVFYTQAVRTNLDYRFTGQYIIDFLFLYILICHIYKIKYLQDENRRLWENLSMLLEREKETKELIKDLIVDLEDMTDKIWPKDEK